jgi:hypothetical protein
MISFSSLTFSMALGLELEVALNRSRIGLKVHGFAGA